MKIRIVENENDRTLNKNYIEIENNEWNLDQYFFNNRYQFMENFIFLKELKK